jgi:hypothetical protein
MAGRRTWGRESGMGRSPNAAQLLELMRLPVGQRYPTHCPSPPAPSGGPSGEAGGGSRLGQPLDIRQVAGLVGCSPWSIRNTWLPRGMPHFRSGASSKLIFYQDQVVRWIERQQQKGG